jgi:hypothetical protein
MDWKLEEDVAIEDIKVSDREVGKDQWKTLLGAFKVAIIGTII